MVWAILVDGDVFGGVDEVGEVGKMSGDAIPCRVPSFAGLQHQPPHDTADQARRVTGSHCIVLRRRSFALFYGVSLCSGTLHRLLDLKPPHRPASTRTRLLSLLRAALLTAMKTYKT